MREILFRGKTLKTNKWVYGSCNLENTLAIISRCAVIPKTIGQYTGLKDKNGTKIFEFDICKAYIHISKVGKKQLTGAICFEEGTFKFKCKRYIFNIYDLSASIEVIGNAFDSPELLEGDKT